jgi:hypothetical protein
MATKLEPVEVLLVGFGWTAASRPKNRARPIDKSASSAARRVKMDRRRANTMR